MNLVTALAIVIGVLGGVATWLYVGPVAGLGLQIWATFIAWACFFHCGGKEDGLKNTIAGNIWGAIMGTIVLILVQKAGGGAMGAGLWVAITVAVLIFAAQIPLLGSIPAGVYGYAATAGFALLKGSDALDFSLGTGPFTTVVVSMVIGAVLGYISEKIAGAIVTGRATA
jgi:Protein of unknown function (DUF1097)